MSDKRFRVAILDDFEKLADTVPAYEKLKARADVTILRERLDSPEKIERTLKRWTRCFSCVNALTSAKMNTACCRPESYIANRPHQQASRFPSATQPRHRRSGNTGRQWHIHQRTHHRADLGSHEKNTPSQPAHARGELAAVAGRLLEGKLVGVLGFGRIGQEVARILKAFDARVLAYARTLTAEKAGQIGAECVPMDTLLKESDVVTIHVPLNANTRGMIGDKELAMMKPGALLVNTARGAIVSETAMLKALETGHLGGVGLDVFEIEPLPMDHPLRRFDNAILLSHRGYATVEVLQERYEEAMTNILNFIDGKPVNLHNPEVLKP